MPAYNLLFVNRDNVFNCYDQISGYTKKRYQYTLYSYPQITDVLQEGTILVIASHAGTTGIRSNATTAIGATEFVNSCIIPNITNASRITKVVYLACSVSGTVIANPNFAQVAPNALITYSVFPPPPSLTVAGATQGMTPMDVIQITENANGWIYTA